MIYYNSNTINDWNFGDDNIIKVYRNGAVVFYKFDSEQGGYKVCFAVVDDITQYSETEFEDVFNKADGKWYKLNNLDEYEQYGVYGSGRSVTTYNGKLTIDDGYEYEWNGSSWVNLGEVSGSSKSSGFTSSDIGESGATSGFSDGDYVIISYKNNNSSTTPSCIMSYKNDGTYDRVNNFSGHTGSNTLTPNTIIDAAVWKFEGTATADTYYIKNVENGLYWGYQDTNTSRSFYLVDDSQKAPILIDDYDGYIGLIEKKYLATSYFGGYGLNQLYGYTYQLGWLNSGTGSEANFYATDGNALYALYKVNGGTTEYPKYYSEKSEPLDDLTFNTLEEAQAYAEANCVYDGMHATIDGDRYYFDSTDENGWVKVTGTIWLDPSATNALFSIGHYWGENYKMVITTYLSGSYSGDYGSFWQYNEHTPIEFSFYSNGFYYDFHNPTSTTAPNVYTGDYSWRIMKNGTLNSYENGQILNIILSNGAVRVELESTGAAIVTGSASVTVQNWYSGLYLANIGLNNANAKCHLSHIQIYNGNNELVNDFKFVKNNGVVGSQEISIYDSVTDTTYNNTNSNTPIYHIEA